MIPETGNRAWPSRHPHSLVRRGTRCSGLSNSARGHGGGTSSTDIAMASVCGVKTRRQHHHTYILLCNNSRTGSRHRSCKYQNPRGIGWSLMASRIQAVHQCTISMSPFPTATQRHFLMPLMASWITEENRSSGGIHRLRSCHPNACQHHQHCAVRCPTRLRHISNSSLLVASKKV